MKGWECPKCGRVWGPQALACDRCNGDIQAKESAVRVMFDPRMAAKAATRCPDCKSEGAHKPNCRVGAMIRGAVSLEEDLTDRALGNKERRP